MPFDFLSLPGFLFLFIVVWSGYFFAEVILGDDYFGKEMLRRYEHNLFDRILHYVFWGVSINILFFSSLVYAGMVSHLEESGNLGRDLAKAFPGGDAYGDQSYFFLFAFDYWGLLFVALFSILFAVKIPTIVRFLTDSLSKKTEK